MQWKDLGKVHTSEDLQSFATCNHCCIISELYITSCMCMYVSVRSPPSGSRHVYSYIYIMPLCVAAYYGIRDLDLWSAYTKRSFFLAFGMSGKQLPPYQPLWRDCPLSSKATLMFSQSRMTALSRVHCYSQREEMWTTVFREYSSYSYMCLNKAYCVERHERLYNNWRLCLNLPLWL